MDRTVVITGIGLVTPLGRSPETILDRIARDDRAASKPSFDAGPVACPVCAVVPDFDAKEYFPNSKNLRFMNLDAKLAAAAARLALQDASFKSGETYPPDEIALFGATGLTALAADEISMFVKHAAGPDGVLDLKRFGHVTLKRVRPILSFKLLSNMAISFISIFENIRGENAVYTPWEGQGAQAIAAGVRVIRRGAARAALVGGCDVKTREFSLILLQQLGAFNSWTRHGQGSVPGEGAAFLVLEDEHDARARRAPIYARILDSSFRTTSSRSPREETFAALLADLHPAPVHALVAASDGDLPLRDAENHALRAVGVNPTTTLHPKAHVGNLFAAAAALQVALAASLAREARSGARILADCFNHRSQQAAFLLEAP